VAEDRSPEPDDEDASRSRSRRLQAGLVAAVVLMVFGLGAFGVAGLLATMSVVAVATGAVALAGVPRAPTPRRRPRPGPPVENVPFRSYRQVAESLSWAEVSPRHYDLVTRPLLVQLMTSRLADHHRIDLATDRDAAHRLVGDDVWYWLDPDREVAKQGQPPGVDLATLTRIIERLETL
jgi:hypothetical protein